MIEPAEPLLEGAAEGWFWVLRTHFLCDIFVISLRDGGHNHGGRAERRAVCVACGVWWRRTIPMLAFGVVCLAFDVDDDPEHMSCGGGTVR